MERILMTGDSPYAFYRDDKIFYQCYLGYTVGLAVNAVASLQLPRRSAVVLNPAQCNYLCDP